MAKMMNIPILGIVENYSYFECPDCHGRHYIYGKSNIDEIAKEYGIDVLAKLPIDTKLPALCDRGMIELMENDYLTGAFEAVDEKLSKK
jgi:MinD superfamily P-loop ATPase